MVGIILPPTNRKRPSSGRSERLEVGRLAMDKLPATGSKTSRQRFPGPTSGQLWAATPGLKGQCPLCPSRQRCLAEPQIFSSGRHSKGLARWCTDHPHPHPALVPSHFGEPERGEMPQAGPFFEVCCLTHSLPETFPLLLDDKEQVSNCSSSEHHATVKKGEVRLCADKMSKTCC